MARTLFIAPVFHQYPFLVHALQGQTDPDWELLLVHDGPGEAVAQYVQQMDERRVHYVEFPEHQGNYGHALRDWALNEVAARNIPGDFIVITNADNYYVPGFLEMMLPEFDVDVVAVYCAMLHNYCQWLMLDTILQEGLIDGGCIVVRREVALSVRWTSRRMQADWDYIAGVIRNYGPERIRKVPRVLFVHN